MSVFGEYLGRESEPVTRFTQGSGKRSSRHVVGMACHFCRHEKTRVEPVRHTRSPSMSSYQESRVPRGLRIRPRSNGGRSSGLQPLPLAFVNLALRTNRSSSANCSAENCRTAASTSASVLMPGNVRFATSSGKHDWFNRFNYKRAP